MLNKRLVIITGHYGSGKTEFCVNFAIKLKQSFKDVCLADLDIINPYFRSREKKDFLLSSGIKVIDSCINSQTLEIPALSPEIAAVIQNQNIISVLDVGGDPAGAKVLARFSQIIKKNEYDLLYVINVNRPETQNKNDIIKYLREIEKTSGLNVTGLINNTHLLKETSVADVEKGHQLTKEVSLETDLPIMYESVIKSVANKIKNKDIKEKIFPMELYMREDWMS